MESKQTFWRGLTGGEAVPLANTAIAAKAAAFTKMERAGVLGAAGTNLGRGLLADGALEQIDSFAHCFRELGAVICWARHLCASDSITFHSASR